LRDLDRCDEVIMRTNNWSFSRLSLAGAEPTGHGANLFMPCQTKSTPADETMLLITVLAYFCSVSRRNINSGLPIVLPGGALFSPGKSPGRIVGHHSKTQTNNCLHFRDVLQLVSSHSLHMVSAPRAPKLIRTMKN
jgi:hypothetical protein